MSTPAATFLASSPSNDACGTTSGSPAPPSLFPVETPVSDKALTKDLRALVENAVRAPSGDNLQPWRIEIFESRRAIRVSVDASADLSPMNAGQRMSRIAVGAAIENIMRVAAKSQWNPACTYDGDGVVVTLRAWEESRPIVDDPVIVTRHTDRRFYDKSPVGEAVRAKLTSLSPLPDEGVQVAWIVERPAIAAWSKIIARADGLMFGHPSFRRAFLENVRFDLPSDELVDRGLGISTLNVTSFEAGLLQRLKKTPDWLCRALGVHRSFAAKSRRLVRSSSGLLIGWRRGDDATDDYLVGRAMQHAWLGLTELGFAVQPMMSLAVLENAALHVGGDLRQFASTAVRDLRGMIASERQVAEGQIGFVLRFGSRDGECARTGRLPSFT
jgi:nitroreductase